MGRDQHNDTSIANDATGSCDDLLLAASLCRPWRRDVAIGRDNRLALFAANRPEQTLAIRRESCPGPDLSDEPSMPTIRGESRGHAWEEPMHVLTMLNQKGGVGKTSTTAHLSGTLGAMGRRVLLIDADPQGSLTQGFYGPLAFRELDPAETIAAMFAGHRPFASQVVRPTGVAGVDLVPGSKAATLYNVPCPELSDPDQQRCIRDFLDQARDDYDLVLIDVPPNLHLCSWAALVASDSIVVPLQPEDYGAQGIDPVLESVAEVQAGPNPALSLLGFLVTMFDKRLGIHATYDAHLREMYGAEVFAAQFPMAKDFKEAIAARLPIALYKPKSAAAKAVKAIADELLARVDSRRIAAMMKEAG